MGAFFAPIYKKGEKMKLGAIKLESLYLCFPNPQLYVDTDDDALLSEALSNLKDDANYADYLNAMIGAINRCLSVFEIKGVIPKKRVSVPFTPSGVKDGSFVIRMSSLAPDAKRVDSVITYPKGDLPLHIEFADMGDGEIYVEPISEGGCYTVRYEPVAERISQLTPEGYEINLPNRLAELIPYFVKGDILRVDDPEEAKDAYTLFYGLLEEIKEGERLYSNIVRTVYKMD